MSLNRPPEPPPARAPVAYPPAPQPNMPPTGRNASPPMQPAPAPRPIQPGGGSPFMNAAPGVSGVLAPQQPQMNAMPVPVTLVQQPAPAPGQQAPDPQYVVGPQPAPVFQQQPAAQPPPPPQVVHQVTQPFITLDPYMRRSEHSDERFDYYRPASASHPLHVMRPYRATSSETASLPPSADFREFCGDVRDQGAGPAEGFAAALFREALYRISGKQLPGRLSARYLWARSQLASHEGRSVTDEVSTLMTWGTCPEVVEQGQQHDPHVGAVEDISAKPFRLLNAFPVEFLHRPTVQLLLASKHPIVIGFAVHESFVEPNADGVLPVPAADEPILGGHAVLVVGYDARGWIIQNSFGPGWGVDGYAIMPYGYEAAWFEAWSGQEEVT